MVAREEAERAGGSGPQSADDFDRLLLSSPNSSYLHIQYIAFHVAMAEVERLIRREGLRRIGSWMEAGEGKTSKRGGREMERARRMGSSFEGR